MKTKLFKISLTFVFLYFANASNGNISYYEDAYILPGPGWNVVGVYDTPPSHTTVTMLGGNIDLLLLFDESTFNMIDGHVNTFVNWEKSTSNLSGGYIDFLQAADGMSNNGIGYQTVNVSGNITIGGLKIGSNALANINDGQINSIFCEGDSKINLYSGTTTSNIKVGGNSLMNIYGGKIENSINNIRTEQNSSLIFHGSNFYVNGNLMNYGESARLYGNLVTYSNGVSVLMGTLTGILSNGDILDTSFKIYDTSDITFVPEPATIFLLGIGGLFLRRKNTK
jgi:hypothetical protein